MKNKGDGFLSHPMDYKYCPHCGKKGYYRSGEHGGTVFYRCKYEKQTYTDQPLEARPGGNKEKNKFGLTIKQVTFLNHVCSDLKYSEIAGLMGISPRSVDTHRDLLFKKLNIKTRAGLILYAIKCKIFDIEKWGDQP